MPRMMAAFAVLALVVGSIALNVSRYPVVWEMTRPVPCSVESAEEAASEDPAATVSPRGTPDHVEYPPGLPRSIALEKPGPPTDTGARPWESSRAAASASPSSGDCGASFCTIRPVPTTHGPTASPPAAQSPSPPDAWGEIHARSEASPEAASARDRSALVPVFTSDRYEPSAEAASRGSGLPGDSLAAGGVRRLPPVERTGTPAVLLISRPVDEPTPIYPSTGR